ncbi:zinc finger protein 585A-like [Uranotaenia lowii]|uniref:zinc finger protein 585A-like n=1 Tax=Uranotaenia lowii TaxID=190385 RepID=UPI0024791B1B|nr:zinc finger protein 585A-like [Uranotaenia lowii]
MSDLVKLDDVCRTCMKNSSEMRSIFGAFEQTTIDRVVSECTGVMITQDTHLPDQICKSCIRSLKEYVKFIKTTRSVDKKLRNLLKSAFVGQKCSKLQVLVKNIQPNPPSTEIIEIKQESEHDFSDEGGHFAGEDDSNSGFKEPDFNNSHSEPETLYQLAKEEPALEDVCPPSVEPAEVKVKKRGRPRKCETMHTNSSSATSKPIRKRKEKDSDNNPSEWKQRKRAPSTDSLDDVEREFFKPVTKAAGEITCCKCLRFFKNTNELTAHARSVHPLDKSQSNRPYRCEICSKGYLNFRGVEVHREKIENEYCIFECQSCGERFINRQHRKTHAHKHRSKGFEISEEQLRELGFLCCSIMCSKSYETEAELLVHAEQIHGYHKIEVGLNQQNADRNFQCNVCFKQFMTEESLLRHRARKYRPKQHICMVCGEKFVGRHELVDHEKTHNDKKEFKCETCQKEFHTKMQYSDHLRRHQAGKYACDQCGKTFKQSNSLKAHLLMHAGQTPFVCEVCNKGFVRKFKLIYHMRTHTGEKPYVCKFCGHAFADHTNHKRHEMTHMKDDLVFDSTLASRFT